MLTVNVVKCFVSVIRTVVLTKSQGFLLYRVNSTSQLVLYQTPISSLPITDYSQSATSLDNLMAYRPSYSSHSSTLAALFLNIQGIFPCLAHVPQYNPLCYLMAHEEEGFRTGRSFLEAADEGEEMRIFGSTDDLPTYGIAIEECTQFTDTCWPAHAAIAVSCQLPYQHCA